METCSKCNLPLVDGEADICAACTERTTIKLVEENGHYIEPDKMEWVADHIRPPDISWSDEHIKWCLTFVESYDTGCPVTYRWYYDDINDIFRELTTPYTED